jgi:coatomer subunit beta'
MNVAYTCYFLTNKPNKCVDVLLKGKKYSESALFSRTYCPERVEECVRLWKESIPDKMIANKISDLQEEEDE